jgi:hypothetical protein
LIFFLLQPSIFFLDLCACCFNYKCHGEVLFWSYLLGVLEAFCTWIGISFLRFGKFSAIILLNIFPMPLAYTSSPFSVTMIHRLGLLKESQSSCVFLSQLFGLFSKYSLIPILSLSPEILSSTCSSLLERAFHFHFPVSRLCLDKVCLSFLILLEPIVSLKKDLRNYRELYLVSCTNFIYEEKQHGQFPLPLQAMRLCPWEH